MVNQILEDILRACALAQGPKWEDCLPYAEFSYNNSFQASLKMSSYEALYGRKCRTPLNWSQTKDSHIFGNRSHDGSWKASTRNPRPSATSQILTKELLWYKAPTGQFWARRTSIPQSHSYEGSQKVSDSRRIGNQVYWSIPSYV